MKKHLALVIVLLSATAHAETYTHDGTPFETWQKQNPNFASIMNLHPTFTEPKVQVPKSGGYETRTLSMVMMTNVEKATANKAAINVNLANMISEASIKQLDAEAKIRTITAAQIMPKVAGKGKITNFDFCNANPADPHIFLPKLERSQEHMSRPGREWCTDTRTACYETCRLAPKVIRGAVELYNAFKTPGKDYGVAVQSEVRYHKNEAEFGKTGLANITGVNSRVDGVIEITMFYVDQIMVYGKMLVVLQADPKDAQKTVVSVISAFGVRKHDWTHSAGGDRVQALLRSKSVMNADQGILAGIPKFTKNSAQIFANIAEK